MAARSKVIEVTDLAKSFSIPSTRRDTVREHALAFFRPCHSETLRVLDGVSFAVESGETLGITGRNGSGKSTLLKIIAGIYQPDGGRVVVRAPVTPILELGVGWNPDLTAIDNALLLGTVMGLTLREAKDAIDEILTFAELEQFADLELRHYSSGMAARLAYSVAFRAAREILLLDEIFAVGDASFRSKCERRFKELKAAGHTVLFVSHDPGLVAELCDRALLLQDGRIVMDGSGAQVASAYVSRVADEAVERGTHRRAMEAVLRKHRRSVEALGPAVLLAKESLIVGQKEHLEGLERRQAGLESELAVLEGEIASLTSADGRSGDGRVNWGDLRRLQPLSAVWGLDRGTPVDRYYIQQFLDAHRADIRGRVLEVKDPGYTNWFGGGAVTEREVIDIDPRNPRATIVADLTRGDGIPDRFDCFILTQTLQFIRDVPAALFHAHRVLKPGGALLCTLPCVSRIADEEIDAGRGDYWRFTEGSARMLFEEVFPRGAVEVTAAGNVLACAAFLYGLAAEELSRQELDHVDAACPLILLVRAVKQITAPGA